MEQKLQQQSQHNAQLTEKNDRWLERKGKKKEKTLKHYATT